MKLCILGVTGLLGQALAKEASTRNLCYTGVARSNANVCLDITSNKDLEDFVREHHFDVIINTCAIVNHSLCDKNPEAAYCTNARPNALLSNLSKELWFKFVFISTDGYFCGDRDCKHDETSNVKLLNEYARTKFAGECFTLTNPKSLVVRTNIVGFKGMEQPTFLEWVINSLKNKEKMTLFDDYYTSSITVNQFSKALFDLLAKNPNGIINLASSEVFSKAKFIISLSEALDLPLIEPRIGSVSQLSSKRADSLGLDVSKAESILGYKLPDLESVIKQIKEEFNEIC